MYIFVHFCTCTFGKNLVAMYKNGVGPPPPKPGGSVSSVRGRRGGSDTTSLHIGILGKSPVTDPTFWQTFCPFKVSLRHVRHVLEVTDVTSKRLSHLKFI